MKYKRIHTLEQYKQYCNKYELLLMKDVEKYADEIDLLELLIEDYDNRTIDSIGMTKDMDPVEILNYMMAENNISKATLARELNVSRQLITEISNYKRNISKKMVMKLSKRFALQPIAFNRFYELKGESEKSISL